MTIVFFCRLFYPHIGGVEKHVMEIAKRLVSLGNKLIIITESSLEVYSEGNKPILFEIIDNIEVYRIPVEKNESSKKWIIWRWMWKNKQIWHNADILHFHDVFFWYLPFRLLNLSKNAYITFHGYEGYPLKKKAVLIRKLAEILTNGNICIGDFIKKWYGTKSTYVSYGAVNISKEKKVHQPSPFSALFYGRLDNQTGITIYDAAMIIINKKYPQFSLTIIGDGPLRDKIDDKIRRFGYQINISEYLKNNRFVFISSYLSILEALAAKRLVFAVYDNPIKKDYLEMAPFASFIIIENSHQKLAEKVAFFIKNPTLEAYKIEEGYKWVKNQTWDSVVKLYLKLWNKHNII
ncbi:glycosyl transferase [Candidatus Levyibacteriota bacterium]|nr:glycosyltransferase family 4 protein [Candidatus Levybacteria bacterium]MSU25866.1 glycosyltransferase [Candidatus Levybacteria bacterium]GDX61908.1 glycosyl transferase [Candidatus Levybacteria bacterium]